MQFQIDFSDDEDYDIGANPTTSSTPYLDGLPPLTLADGAKASIRVDEVHKSTKRYSTSSRFSIPLTGTANYNQMKTDYLLRDSGGFDDKMSGYEEILHAASSEFSEDDEVDEDGMRYIDHIPDTDEPFGIRMGSTRFVPKMQIALSAPVRGSSFSSSTGRNDSIREGFELPMETEEEPTLVSLQREEIEDPFQVPPPTPIGPILHRRRVDMNEFMLKLDGVHPTEYRRLRSADQFVSARMMRHSPTTTPQNVYEPQTFEKLVAKVYKVTPRDEEVTPFYDNVYGPILEANTPNSLTKEEIALKTPVIVDDDEDDDDLPLPPEPDARDEQLRKFRMWFERHNLDPCVVDIPVGNEISGMGGVPTGGLDVIHETFMTPSPKLAFPPLFDVAGNGGLSAFSNSSGTTTDISRLGVTPSPLAPVRPYVGKLEEENERLTFEVRSRTSALDQAVSEMGQMRFQLAKLQQQLTHAEKVNVVLREQVDDLVESRHKILITANHQFDICRKKVNPTRH